MHFADAGWTDKSFSRSDSEESDVYFVIVLTVLISCPTWRCIMRTCAWSMVLQYFVIVLTPMIRCHFKFLGITVLYHANVRMTDSEEHAPPIQDPLRHWYSVHPPSGHCVSPGTTHI
ncbi:hypothetical protein DFH94DRAFT_4409 [Russula ochroleuca]|jgi:hypothetical protein|uniref:Uncharacterized protein n=1 Tax=Russula ochroleuca TaxID=152965 RepID=A0A9P5MM38_9AGAM|nr:hypothetical protein DFH94DRAFT_96516 [Russula ochroleuca]KAF8486867.1 hypothetical protein DFH94DRAFT_4409 [Russula ochroleuca]